jgi:hypothetical protein
MPPKKTKQQPLNQVNMFVVLCNNKTSHPHVLPRDKLSYAKKDDLKVGTFATFNGAGDRSSRCQGIIIMTGRSCEFNSPKFVFGFIGTKQQCENSAMLIEKTNNASKGQEGSESDSSNHLIIDDQSGKSEDENNCDQEAENEDGMSSCILMSQQDDGVMSTNGNSTASSKTTLVNNRASLHVPLTTASSGTGGESV